MLRHTEFTKLRVKVRLELGIILSLGKFDISYSGEGNFNVLILHAPITTTIIYDDLTFFPNKLKMSLDSRFCKLIRAKKLHQTVGGRLLYSYLVRPKKDQKTKLTKKYPDCRSDVVG